MRKIKILWLGLSMQKNSNKALDAKFPSGKIVQEIIDNLDPKKYLNKKTNLVNFAPLNPQGKLRYPTKVEITKCFPDFQKQVNDFSPDIIITLGKITTESLAKSLNINLSFPATFKYKLNLNPIQNLLAVHHPSYILIYKRKKLSAYKKSILQALHTI